MPDHELLRIIGRGSYGEVWLARNKLGTLRAIKIVYRATFEDRRPFEREFKGIQKFEPLSRSHEGLVDILQVGGTEDYFYYVMELADDADGEMEKRGQGAEEHRPLSPIPPFSPARYTPRTLRALIRPNPQPSTLPPAKASERRAGNSQPAPVRLPIADCVEIGLALSSALAHLHRHGLTHRDVKPSNIIFVNGVPKLADIGLVAEMSEARSYVGTEGFIPPEGPGSPQADLYSLGKVLYEISTGHDRRDFPALPEELDSGSARVSRAESGVSPDSPLPHNSRNEAELTDKVFGGPPKAARGPCALPFLELNAVVVKACKTDPRERYRSADEMHADLELLQRGKSVKRKRVVERRVAFLKVVGAVSVVTALLFAVAGFLTSRQFEQQRIHRQQAEKLFLEGRKYASNLTKDGYSKAVELYHQAIAIAPEYAPAYIGLAETHILVSGWHLPPREAMSPARWAITKALELDYKSAAAHAWFGRIKQLYEWDWRGAEQEYRRAIELAPKDGIGHSCLLHLLSWLGRFEEADAELAKFQRLVPLSPRNGYDAGLLLYFERRYDEAIAQALKTLALDTNSVLNHNVLMDCYLKREMYAEAIFEARILRSFDDTPFPLAELGHIYAVMGRTNEARQCLAELKRLAPTRHVSGYMTGFVHLGLGEKDRALDCLDQAYAERSGALGSLKVDPVWDGLRNEPRFIALLKKLRLEQ